MNLQILLSTMNQTDYELLSNMNLQSDAVVVNQGVSDEEKEFKIQSNNVRWINSSERGLSRSRNLAINNASEEICLISDDDVEYVNNYKKTILAQFEKYPEADIITFQVEGIESKFKNYHPSMRKLNYLTSMKVASVEVAFRLSSVRKAKINFNELFGSGSKFYMGEENIFLFNCLKKKMKIYYVPIKIADVHVINSSWFEGYTEKYFISKGAAFTGMSKTLSYLFILQFAIRKYNLYKNQLTCIKAIKYMIDGRKQYINH
ncbi:glycosyltransferase family 2 protein [Exiguobacterium sp. s56]|uniref:glycosyltransferase family A protein n=1 Tax=Exiguobacterium sp. s56 TaxID=2751232 RepID=UPI001BE61B4B|nr:glycosyltransferase family 2 protein [Exiguobacterium sp. s56]